jgi:signal transduction histidine kinase
MVNYFYSLVSRGVSIPDFISTLFTNDHLGIGVFSDEGKLLVKNKLYLNLIRDAGIEEEDVSVILENGRSDATHVNIVGKPGKKCVRISFARIAQESKVLYLLFCSPFNNSMEKENLFYKDLYHEFSETTCEYLARTSLDGEIQYANSSFLRNFGIHDQAAAHYNIAIFFEEQARCEQIMRRLRETGKTEAEHVTLRRVTGLPLIARVNARVSQDCYGVSVINFAFLDITRQEESEKALKLKNDQLAKVNHQMEKFLYSTSHDLRSPITSILGLINLLRVDFKDPNMADYVNKIEASTLRLDKIIKDIMSFSHATYQRITSQKIDFELMIWKAINETHDDPSAKRIHFDVKSNSQFPFYSDTERISIIIENIIRNSIHFHDRNKSRPFLQINVTPGRQNAVLEFIDNGIGIGQKHLENIFNMFYKASHLSRGAGLGLFIVKETLHALNGSIEVESEVGFGTLVRIKIPNDHKGKLIGRKLELQQHVK